VQINAKKSNFFLFSVIDGKIKEAIIAQYNIEHTTSYGSEIAKWSPNIPIPTCAELKYLNKIKIMDKENNEDESGKVY
jgi:hypothetical protein